MEYRRIDKNRLPESLFDLSLFDYQKNYLDSLPTILKEYSNMSNWLILSIHQSDLNKTLIGFAVIGKFDDGIWLDDIMIDKNYQGMGFGTQAIKDITNFIFNHYQVDYYYLSCYKENEVALKLYKKLGFVETNKLDINGEIILIYYK